MLEAISRLSIITLCLALIWVELTAIVVTMAGLNCATVFEKVIDSEVASIK